MRPILALAILLLGLKAAVPEVKFGTMADLQYADLQQADLQYADSQFQEAKFQDRVPAADEGPLSSDVETTGSIGESGIGESEINQSEINESGSVWPQIGTPETDTAEVKKSDRAVALLTPPSIAASDAAHDQGEATTEQQSPAPPTRMPMRPSSIRSMVFAMR